MGDPDEWVGTYEFQVPIFVVTTHPPNTPPKQDERLTFTFVEDGVVSAVTQAKAAAGEKLVQVVGGSRLIRALLRAGEVDELWIDIMPVLLGSGPRLFEGDGLDSVGLETIKVDTLGQRTSFRFRVTGNQYPLGNLIADAARVIGRGDIGVMNNGLTLMNISSYWQQVASGVLLITAVSFDRLRERFSPTTS